MSGKYKSVSAVLAASALAAAVSMVAVSASAEGTDDMNGMSANMEKCYGVVKAGANDCAGAGHSCAGQASSDASGSEFIMVPAGTCEKLAGGSTQAS